MTQFRRFLMVALCLVLGYGTSAEAATTLKRLAVHPFYRPPLTSEADVKTLVSKRGAELKKGFEKAGNPELYAPFMEQAPTAKIDSVQIAPGETLPWMLFRSRGVGRVGAAKDLTWGGKAPFDAYRFEITHDGKRYEFIVPKPCGNVSLRSVAVIPPPPAAVVPAPPPPAAPAPPPPVAVAPPPPPPPVVTAPAPPPAPRPAPVPPPVVAAPMPPPPAPVPPPPAAMRWGGPVADVGFSHQPDPANYVFARVGYEIPLVERLHLMGLVGGFVRVGGDDGDSGAFTADLLLDYHWLSRLSCGLGAGYWSGGDGQVDLIANLGVRLFGNPAGFNTSAFVEARSAADELEDTEEFGRFGFGLRFRF